MKQVGITWDNPNKIKQIKGEIKMGKFRKSFVTNSSSSSFICEISGRTETGYDMCLSDAGMYECENGHTFDEDYLIGNLEEMNKEEMLVFLNNKKESWTNSTSKYRNNQVKDVVEEIEKLNSLTDEDEIMEYVEELIESYELNSHYEIPASHCPICTMNEIREKDELAFLLQKTGMTKSQVDDEMRKSGYKIK